MRMAQRAVASFLDYVSAEIKLNKLRNGTFVLLQSTFGEEAAAALEVIDKDRITLLRTDLKRDIYVIESSTNDGKKYICYKNAFFCTCPSFHFHVIIQKTQSVCKHIIATRLADAMGVLKIKYIFDEEFVEIATKTTISSEEITQNETKKALMERFINDQNAQAADAADKS